MVNEIIMPDWNSEFVDKHRRGISDMRWADQQPKTQAKYKEGDIVKFMVGGTGIIDVVMFPHNGWPSSYSTHLIAGMDYHARGKDAWHYEGDFKEEK